MAATLIAFAAVLLTILGFVVRISYLTGRLVQRVDDHVGDQARHVQPQLTRPEAPRPARPRRA